jgi:phosphoenolpyruvate carboxykinase (GTP)
MGAKADPEKLPRIYYVNWFRRNDDHEFIWPGFGENSRVLKWVCERVAGKASAIDTPIGRIPARESLDLDGLDIPDSAMDKLLEVDVKGWKSEIPLIRDYFKKFGHKTPAALYDELDRTENRLSEV